MSTLEPVTYYRLPRYFEDEQDDGEGDERGRVSWLDRRPIDEACRWEPPHRRDPGDNNRDVKGFRALKQLAQGDDISPNQLAAAHEYIDESIIYYQANPWGDSAYKDMVPVAVADFERVKEMLT